MNSKFHEWAKYYPNELCSNKNPSYIDTAVYKINDIYREFCYFNINLEFCKKRSDNDNEREYIFFQYMYYQNALFYGNNCIDYFWQMLFCLFQPDTTKVYEHQELEALLKTESLTSVVDEQIEYLIKLEPHKTEYIKIKKIKNELEEYINLKKIRNKYNYLKHRGVFHVEGLEDNNTCSFEKFGIKVSYHSFEDDSVTECSPKKLIYREKLCLEDSISDLENYQEKFSECLNTIISIAIPSNYICEQGGFREFLQSYNLPHEIQF